MKAFVNIEIASASELVALARALDSVGFNADEEQAGAVINAEAASEPKPRRTRKPKTEAPAEQPAAEQPAAEQPTEPESAVDIFDEAEVVEAVEIKKSDVADALRKFMLAKGSTEGPKAALAILKDFGAKKFDEVKPEDYGKLLSRINQSA